MSTLVETPSSAGESPTGPRQFSQRYSSSPVSSRRCVGLFPSGIRLNVSSNRLPLPRLLDLVEPLKERLTALDASQNDLGDAAPQSLFRCLPALRELHLGGCGVGAQGMSALVTDLRCQNIRNASPKGSPLRSSRSMFGGSPRDSMKGSAKGSPKGKVGSNSQNLDGIGLQVLDLSACNVDTAVPEMAAYLADVKCTLTSLDLSFNVLGPEAIRNLGTGLQVNTTLRCLRLAHCHLREEAARLCESIKVEHCSLPLTHLCLARNHLSDFAFKELAAFMASPAGRRLEILDIAGNPLSEEGASRSFGRGIMSTQPVDSGTMRLDLSGTRPFFDVTFGRWDLTSSHVLTGLRMPTCRFLEVVMDQCSSLPETAMPTLARICLNVRVFSFCAHANGEAFVHALAELTRALVGGQLRSSGCGSPVDSTDDFTPPSPRNGKRSHRGLRLCLQKLHLNDTALQDHSIVLLSDTLEWLRGIRRDGLDLEVLEIAGNHLGVDSIDSLGPSLVENVYLRRLVLSRNRLRHAGAVRLAELLSSRDTSTSPLDLALRHCSLTTEGVVRIWGAILCKASKVFAVDLADNALDNSGLEAMHGMMPRVRPSDHILHNVNLLPNACTTSAVIALLVQFRPWKRIPVHDGPLDAPTFSQLLYSLGADTTAGDAANSPRNRGLQSPTNGSGSPLSNTPTFAPRIDAEVSEYNLSLTGTSMLPTHWQWGVIVDAMKTATAPIIGGECSKRKILRKEGDPWKRVGGCGAELVVELDRCELGRSNFKVPSSTPVSIGPVAPVDGSTNKARASSLARSARKEIFKRVQSDRAESSAAATTQRSSLAARARSTGGLRSGMTSMRFNSSCSSVGGDQEALSPSNASVDVLQFCESGASVPSEATSPIRTQRSRLSNNDLSPQNLVAQTEPDFAMSPYACLATGTSLGSRQAPTSLQPKNKDRDAKRAQATFGKGLQSWVFPFAHPDADGQQQAQLARSGGAFGRIFERKGDPQLQVATVLRELRSLESVLIESCGVNDRWLTQLCSHGGTPKWSAVRSLDLRYNELTESCCQALTSVLTGGLEALIMDGNHIQAEGLETLCSAIQSGGRCRLRWLSVAENDIGHPGGFVAGEMLGRTSGCPLQGLSLARNPLLSSGELIAIFRALSRQAKACGTKGDQTTELNLGAGRALEVLDLAATGADTPVIPQLSRAMAHCPDLSVDLRECPVVMAGATSTMVELAPFLSEGRLLL